MNAASVPLRWASQHLLLASSPALPCCSPGFLGVSFENCHSGGTWSTQLEPATLDLVILSLSHMSDLEITYINE